MEAEHRSSAAQMLVTAGVNCQPGDCPWTTECLGLVALQSSFEGAVEDGRKQGIQWCVQALPAGGLGWQALQATLAGLQHVQLGHDPALFGGLKARHVIAWGEAPGEHPKPILPALKGRNR